jgi:hypothetical protein
MKTRRTNRAIAYYRRSDDKQEASLGQQHHWAREQGDKLGVVFRGSVADVERMQQRKLVHDQDIYIDDAVTGGDLSRPGFLQFLAEARTDPTISHVLVFKRDRLGRPQDVLQMLILERDLILSGVTLVTHDRVFTPEDVKANEMAYLITSLVEYQEHGKFSPRLGDRMIFVQSAMAAKGYSTGGRAPYGFARALVDADDGFVQWLEDGEKIRRPGHHVRFLPYDLEKLRIWVTMLQWRAAGEGIKRIARKLNELGIPSPDAGRVRSDHGQRHRLPGTWNGTTVRDLCSNPIIAGMKQYAKRSMGRYRRVGIDGPRELTEQDRGPGGRPRTLENPPELRVCVAGGGDAFVDKDAWDALQPKGISLQEGRRIGGQKPTNPDRYALSTRIIDLTEGCGCAMHGRKSGERLIYRCGRYVNSGGGECHHNTVDGDAMLRLVLDALVERVTKAGGRDAIRERLLAKAKAEATGSAVTEEHAALPHLRRRVEELDQDMATASQRMAREKDDARYDALAKAFDEMRAERDAASRRIEELSTPPSTVQVDESPEQKVDRLMEMLDELATVASDAAARQRIRPLVLRLGIWIGLDFEAGKFGKREVRRLRRGVIAFGQDHLPVRMHGVRHVTADVSLPAMPSPRRQAVQPVRRRDLLGAATPETASGGEHENQAPPACCRGPSVDPGASGGDGTGNFRTDEPNSGMEQSRTRSNVGATRFERATSTSRT